MHKSLARLTINGGVIAILLLQAVLVPVSARNPHSFQAADDPTLTPTPLGSPLPASPSQPEPITPIPTSTAEPETTTPTSTAPAATETAIPQPSSTPEADPVPPVPPTTSEPATPTLSASPTNPVAPTPTGEGNQAASPLAKPPLPPGILPAQRTNKIAPGSQTTGGTGNNGEINAAALGDIMAEGFEGTFPSGLWRTYDGDGTTNGEYYWGKDDFNPHTGVYSAWVASAGANHLDPQTSDYPNNLDSWMVYGPFSLSGAISASLSFSYWNKSEAGYDFFFWGASNDGVNFHGFNTSGDSGGWVSQVLDLANLPDLGSLTGQPQIWIAFNFTSDTNLVDKGAFVDDVLLQADIQPGVDLIPFAPPGWDFPIVPSTVTGTHSVTSLTPALDTYIDLAILNGGTAPATTTFTNCLYLDIVQKFCWDSNGLAQGNFTSISDWLLVKPTLGAHTLKIVADVNNTVSEVNENNNTWQRTFTWALLDCTNGFTSTALTASELNTAYAAAHQNGPGILAQSAPEYQIKLLSRQFVPSPGLDPAAQILQQAAAAPGEKKHMLVQLYHSPSDQERADLAALGLELLHYLPDRAWIAALDPARISEYSANPLVRWIGELPPPDRTSPMLNDPAVQSLISSQANATISLMVEFAADIPFDRALAEIQALQGQVVSEVRTINAMLVVLPAAQLTALTGSDSVIWVEPPLPKMDPLNDCVRQRLGGDALQAAPYNLNGSGVDLLIYDVGAVATTHSAFTGRLVIGDSSSTADHSTHVAGTAAGSGAGSPSGRDLKGMATAAHIISYSLSYFNQGTLYTDPADITHDWSEARTLYSADIGTASIGTNVAKNNFPCSWEGAYGDVSQLLDGIVRGSLGVPYIMTWAAGNERNSGRCGTSYHTTAPPANAKNPIQVGSTDSDTDTISAFSSFGPSDDGRIKPVISAPGCEVGGEATIESTFPPNTYSGMCGTSMATPAIAGLAALMVQQYRTTFTTANNPLPSTIKALLIQTAVDKGHPGPDYQYGYGRVDGQAAIDAILSKSLKEDVLTATGETHDYSFTVTNSAIPLKVSLAWDDAPATPSAATQLVNDLDLQVIAPNGTIYYPFILNPASPDLNAVTGADHLNNQEQVVIPTPVTTGVWTIRVNAYNLPVTPQAYSIVFDGAFTAPVDKHTNCYTLSKSSIPSAGGSVNLNPSPNCNGNTQYSFGTVVTLTAVPASGYGFMNWSGDASGSANPVTVAMTTDKSVSANFSNACFTLTTSVSPAGGGAVAVNVSRNCNAGTQYIYGTVVQLTATPSDGFTFSTWSGADSTTANPAPVTMNADHSVTANFTQQCFILTKSANPTAGGSITANPLPDCANGTQYTNGTTVSLTAVPATGYNFTQWSGDASGSGNPTSVIMNTAHTVTAAFTQQCFSLTLSTSPGAGGNVNPSPAPNCGTQYTYGTPVSLNASPNTGYNFTGWSGDASGSINPVSVSMTAGRSVIANFTLQCFTLTNSASPSGAGTISADLPPDCATQYTYGTTLSLTANPADGYAFTSWSGAVSGTTNPTPVTMTAARSVTANFEVLGVMPAEGSTVLTTRPTLDWLPTTGAASYTLQVSSSPTFSSFIVNKTVVPSIYTLTTDLGRAIPIYWRTRPAGTTTWSAHSFISANPPGKPGLSAPANASLATSYTPLLDWSASSLPKGTVFNYYRLQVAANSTFTSLVQDVNIAGLANHFFRLTTALNPNLTFFWRVAAYNTSGQYSLWSAVRSFRTPMLPPVLISPANPTIPPTLRPTFTWNKVDPAISYGFQVSTSSKFTSTVINTTVTGLSYTPTANLPANRTLFWRVHANGANPSAWALYFTFTSPNPPSAPTLALPANASLVSTYTPRLDWSTSSVPTGASFDHYRLQIATDKGFTTSLQDITVPGLNTNSEKILTTPLEPNRTFYWRVSAYNTAGQYSLFSAVRSFRTPMLPPVLVEPANLGQAMTTRPTFTWNAVSGATGYAIQVSTTAKFTSTLVNTTTKSLSFTPTSDLPRSKTLYWRVHADGANPSAWATNFTFTSANPPVVPVLLSPADNATFNYYTPTLDWNDPAYADRYWVQIATASTFTTASVVVNEPSITSSTFTPASPLAANTIFYWRVRVYNAGGQYSNWSAVRHFHTTLPKPALSTPLNNAPGVLLKPNFTWSAVSGATSYVIQVSTSSSFTSTTINKAVSIAAYTPSSNLVTRKTYYWRVQAKGTFNSPWSTVYNFTTQ